MTHIDFWKTTSPLILAGISTKREGYSKPPIQHFNLAMIAEEPNTITQLNREIFSNIFDISPSQLALGKQCHGNSVLEINKPGIYDQTDGFITNQENLLIAISIADCIPVLFYDDDQQWIGAVHAGWRGVIGLIHIRAVQQLQKNQVELSKINVIIGPGIQACHFETGEDVFSQFPDDVLTQHPYDPQKRMINLQKVLATELEQLGINKQKIVIDQRCTFCEIDTFYSFRRDKGITGRQWAGIIRKANHHKL